MTVSSCSTTWRNTDVPSGSELAERDFKVDASFWWWRPSISVFSDCKIMQQTHSPFRIVQQKKKKGWGMECVKPSDGSDSPNNWSDLGLNSKVILKICNGILAWFCLKTQGTVAEVMAKEMGTVLCWAAGFTDTRGGLWGCYKEPFHGVVKRTHGHLDEYISSVYIHK